MELSQHLEELEQLIAHRLLMQVNGTPNQPEQGTQTTALKPIAQNLPLPPDFVKIEKNLASLGFFTPSSKRIKNIDEKTITFTRTIEGKRIEAKVIIAAIPRYGIPITADQDKYIAFQKIVTDLKHETGAVKNPIGFTSAQLLRLLGKRVRTGKNYQSISEWLDVMTSATIISEGTVYFAGKKTFAKDRFHVFDRAVSVGKELPDGTIADRNYVWMSEWQIENINNNYLLPVDFEEYKQLTNHIAKALVPLLQIWLYASKEEGAFEKRYDELCQVLNIRAYKHLSDIKRKFSTSLDELVAHGYLSSWSIEKTADQKNYKIIFQHGEKFYEDHRKRAVKKTAPSKQLKDATTRAAKKRAEQGSIAKPEAVETSPQSSTNLSKITAEDEAAMQRLIGEFGVAAQKAYELITSKPHQTRQQLRYWAFRSVSVSNPAGWIIEAIEANFAPPKAFTEAEAQEQAKIKVQHRKSAIDACRLCDPSGFRRIKNEKYPSGAMKTCTHNPDIEGNYQDA
jgi:hypothetical protein